MNKRFVWFAELFLWAVVILALILGFTYKFAKDGHKNHSYYMFFEDVDGLSQGSPVRLMGHQIGYVRDVKVFDDNIFVSFLVTEQNVQIPSGSIARVEFYGLGGSKSLEIEPPKDGKVTEHSEIIMAKNPYRIADYYNWGKEINSTIEIMAVNASNTLDAVVKSGFNMPFLVKSAHKINNVIQSFIKNEKLNQTILKNKDGLSDNEYNSEDEDASFSEQKEINK